ncbi:Predicted transcriptional regulator YdeE, contains AraC-type DNA-binding domain [Seinonella peptonophila]|uniref:Predicted transcriptional regulator YdeE, contains AraC-type DNA-binding domain n=2 Tax=Seinonella peptonophila TaxID=112248 RepID=A0A1M4YW35_9BACL|nr:Predicted transcriptional regulator YdeE, contains AraC-type DNA-binding domain [Seinonella peptonophila]
MENYTLEEKDSFTVLGIGTELTDYTSLAKDKSAFWKTVNQDGRLDTLKSIATNDYIFAVNEAVNNKMMHYAGVMTEAPESVSALGETRIIQFPKGEYLVVKGEEKTVDELNQKLEGIAFGQVLPEAENFAYVGGPNTIAMMGKRNGLVFGEMWIPVVKK